MNRLLSKRRVLGCETLERRNLLAAGLGVDHNFIAPEDVDGSGSVTPYDALQVINNLNQQARAGGQGEHTGGSSNHLLDVDGDGHWAPADAWTIINYLNRHGIQDGLAGSLVPLHNRIEALEHVIEQATVPAWLGLSTAHDVLADLYIGLRPELNPELRSTLDDALDRLHMQFQYDWLSDQFTSADQQLDNFDSIFSDIGSHLGDAYSQVRGALSNSLGQLHDQASDVLDAIFDHGNGSGDDWGDGDWGDGEFDLPYDAISDIFYGIGSHLEGLVGDLYDELHDLDYSGVLDAIEQVIGQDSSWIWNLGEHLGDIFDPIFVDHSQQFEQILGQLESVYDRVSNDIEDAFNHVADHLGEIGLVSNQLHDVLYYLPQVVFPWWDSPSNGDSVPAF
ncbi:dockerin type I domain-containing protein [Roseimaritima sediminicola]|uniref:dockerin type I domain-containing protein n=1 Tax=Roseimaritima sediminicola TaxID=2662066 RepID=UPI00129842EF|nr:dockerin type I domain-containing protein [Roseimaritima sediminicola]